jgi:hypothetical protein
MIVTQTPADIFIGVLEAIAGGVIVVLCAKYYPLISDYWSVSISARRRRIKVLEHILAKYENDFADSKTLLARIVLKGTITILWFGVILLSVVLGAAFHLVDLLECERQNDCVDYNWTDLLVLHWELPTSLSVLKAIAILSAFYFMLALSVLYREISPEKYRTYFTTRITRLRRRLPEAADHPPSLPTH